MKLKWRPEISKQKSVFLIHKQYAMQTYLGYLNISLRCVIGFDNEVEE